jgi:hypothetical protein
VEKLIPKNRYIANNKKLKIKCNNTYYLCVLLLSLIILQSKTTTPVGFGSAILPKQSNFMRGGKPVVNENLRLEMQAYVLKILVISQSNIILNYNKRVELNDRYRSSNIGLIHI